MAVVQPLLQLLGVLDEVIGLKHDAAYERRPADPRRPAPLGLPEAQPRRERGERDEDRPVVDEVHPFDVEVVPQQPLALVGAAEEEHVLLADLSQVLGLVAEHHGEEDRERDRCPAVAAQHSNAAGAITSRLLLNCRSCCEITGASGRLSAARVSPTSRSFHTKSTWKIASEAMAGRPSGRMILKKIPCSEAPSMRAASIKSLGMPMKKVRSRKIAKGSANAVWNRIRPASVS